MGLGVDHKGLKNRIRSAMARVYNCCNRICSKLGVLGTNEGVLGGVPELLLEPRVGGGTGGTAVGGGVVDEVGVKTDMFSLGDSNSDCFP